MRLRYVNTLATSFRSNVTSNLEISIFILLQSAIVSRDDLENKLRLRYEGVGQIVEGKFHRYLPSYFARIDRNSRAYLHNRGATAGRVAGG